MSSLQPLSSLPVGTSAQIIEIQGGRGLVQRLLGLGLRVGSQVAVQFQRGRGVVVAYQGLRVAIGGGVAERVMVAPVGLADGPQVRAS